MFKGFSLYVTQSLEVSILWNRTSDKNGSSILSILDPHLYMKLYVAMPKQIFQY